MNKLIAKEDFESEDGKFKKGDELLVNDERAMVLTRLGKVDRAPDQTLGVPAAKTVDNPTGASPGTVVGALNVPQKTQQ